MRYTALIRKSLTVVGDEIPRYDPSTLEEDLKVVSRARIAEEITGGFSQAGKMDGVPSFGISAENCVTGSRLAQVKGSTCSRCYSLTKNYRFSNVKSKQQERLEGLSDPLWTPSMIFLVNYFCEKYFRMFDSGDFQHVNMVHNLITIAENTDVQIWCPTREKEMIREATGERDVPENLVLRISATMIDAEPPKDFEYTSTVHVKDPPEGSYLCPAPQQNNKCADCKECYHRKGDISYELH